ncbi:MAG: hypothetical protein ACRD6X_20700 [Pyrinomonadaceae bacterium]
MSYLFRMAVPIRPELHVIFRVEGFFALTSCRLLHFGAGVRSVRINLQPGIALAYARAFAIERACALVC